MSDPCNHDTVTRGTISGDLGDFGPLWTCTECADQFMHADEFRRFRENQEVILDTVTGVFTATLWGLHEHSKGESLDVQPEDAQAVAQSMCDEMGHAARNDDGVCTRCGQSPFLG